MIPSPAPATDQVIAWIDRIVRDGRELTEWEKGFVREMEGKVEAYGGRVSFTVGQMEAIERIMRERCGGRPSLPRR